MQLLSDRGEIEVRYGVYINGEFICHVYSLGPIQSCIDAKNTAEFKMAVGKEENQVYYLTTVPDPEHVDVQ